MTMPMNNLQPSSTPLKELPELDYDKLTKDLDRVKTKVFLDSNAAFLAHIMCNLRFSWDTSIRTAGVNGVSMVWNPYYFHYLTPKGRISILVHELWHIGLIHHIRIGTRDHDIWNRAADTTLDNFMDTEGYEMDPRVLFPEPLFSPNAKTFVNHALDDLSTEQIYDLYTKDESQMPSMAVSGDLLPAEEGGQPVQQQILDIVVAAHTSAKMAKGCGNLPGGLEGILEKFLKPKLPWDKLLRRFFNQLAGSGYSWRKPSRRSQEIYLPGRVPNQPSLDHLVNYFDLSGSVSDDEVRRYCSEMRHCWVTYRPKKMTIVLFDTQIQREFTLLRGEQFEELKVKGRGGTSLVPVREHMIQSQATAAIVFSDLDCRPMEPLDRKIPIIWVAVNARSTVSVPHGQLVFLRE